MTSHNILSVATLSVGTLLDLRICIHPHVCLEEGILVKSKRRVCVHPHICLAGRDTGKKQKEALWQRYFEVYTKPIQTNLSTVCLCVCVFVCVCVCLFVYLCASVCVYVCVYLVHCNHTVLVKLNFGYFVSQSNVSYSYSHFKPFQS